MEHPVARRPSWSIEPFARFELAAVPPLVIVLAFAAILLWLDPAGYRGGGGDDWQYLKAARCAVENGFCLPVAHWGSRFPLIAPTALSLALFGDSRLALSLAPIGFAVATLCLFTCLVQRRFGRIEAMLAGLILAATPAFAHGFAKPNVDLVELGFMLAALSCVVRAGEGGSRWLALLGGVMLALAIQTRPTALAILPLAGVGFAMAPTSWRRVAPVFLVGLAVPLLLELLVYGLVTGDPLFSWKLSLAHSSLHSSELPLAARAQSPLFNPAVIGGWTPSMDLRVHWTVDAILNLFVDPEICLTLITPVALLLLARDRAGGRDLRLLLILLGAAALYFGALTYALAIDPKPRMFLPVAAIGATIAGVLAARCVAGIERQVAIVLMAAILLNGLEQSHDAVAFTGPEAVAPTWIAEARAPLAIETTAAQIMPFSAPVRALPRHPAAGVDHVLLVDEIRCDPESPMLGDGHWKVERSRAFPLEEPAFLASLRRRGVLLKPKPVPLLCQFARDRR